MRQLTLLGFAVVLSACSGTMSGMQSANFNSFNLKQQEPSNLPLSCLDHRVDYVLNTQVVDFELQGGGALNAGFNPSGGLATIQAGFNYAQGRLQTAMQLS